MQIKNEKINPLLQVDVGHEFTEVRVADKATFLVMLCVQRDVIIMKSFEEDIYVYDTKIF